MWLSNKRNTLEKCASSYSHCVNVIDVDVNSMMMQPMLPKWASANAYPSFFCWHTCLGHESVLNKQIAHPVGEPFQILLDKFGLYNWR
jgi:hypothetical protein